MSRREIDLLSVVCDDQEPGLPRVSSRDALARLLWAEIAGSGQQQQDVAATVGISQKHLSRVVNGHDGMQLDMVDRVLAACGRRLVLATEVLTDRDSDE